MERVELDIKLEVFNGWYAESVPGVGRLNVKGASSHKRPSLTVRRDHALVVFFVINRCVDYRCQTKENRFINIIVLVWHLVAADSENFADSFDSGIVTVVGNVVQFHEYTSLLREKREVVQNSNRLFPSARGFSRDNRVNLLPQNAFIGSKT